MYGWYILKVERLFFYKKKKKGMALKRLQEAVGSCISRTELGSL